MIVCLIISAVALSCSFAAAALSCSFAAAALSCGFAAAALSCGFAAAALSCSFAPYKSFVSLLFQYIHYMSYNIIRITILLLYHLWDKLHRFTWLISNETTTLKTENLRRVGVKFKCTHLSHKYQTICIGNVTFWAK